MPEMGGRGYPPGGGVPRGGGGPGGGPSTGGFGGYRGMGSTPPPQQSSVAPPQPRNPFTNMAGQQQMSGRQGGMTSQFQPNSPSNPMGAGAGVSFPGTTIAPQATAPAGQNPFQAGTQAGMNMANPASRMGMVGAQQRGRGMQRQYGQGTGYPVTPPPPGTQASGNIDPVTGRPIETNNPGHGGGNIYGPGNDGGGGEVYQGDNWTLNADGTYGPDHYYDPSDYDYQPPPTTTTTTSDDNGATTNKDNSATNTDDRTGGGGGGRNWGM